MLAATAIQKAYDILLWAGAAFMSVTILLCLIMAIIGPRYTDRVVMVNMICTKSTIMIAVLSFLLRDENLIDISIVYAMISFLAVVVLSKCYLLPHHYSPADPRHIFFSGGQNDDDDDGSGGGGSA